MTEAEDTSPRKNKPVAPKRREPDGGEMRAFVGRLKMQSPLWGPWNWNSCRELKRGGLFLPSRYFGVSIYIQHRDSANIRVNWHLHGKKGEQKFTTD
jgi:hypothetical protein